MTFDQVRPIVEARLYAYAALRMEYPDTPISSMVEPEDATLVDTPGDRLILKGIINTGRGRMSGAKLDGGVGMMVACLDDLDLIADVLPDYALGRRRGLTDEETERRARAALTWAINRILEQGERVNHFTDSAREGEQDEDEKSDI